MKQEQTNDNKEQLPVDSQQNQLTPTTDTQPTDTPQQDTTCTVVEQKPNFFVRIWHYCPGIALCLTIATASWFLGILAPVVGGSVFAIVIGMVISLFYKNKRHTQQGITFCGKKVLQMAVVLLGFGLNLTEIAKVGLSSLPIILSTIATSLIVAFAMHKILKVPANTSILVGVGSSICGGSAIAATAPVIQADNKDIAQSISVIFLFNVLAALIFPSFGALIGLSNEGFGLFAGTAINDTSSVTAAATVWDQLHPDANTLDTATIVKLTRTLAIIPITLILALMQAIKAKKAGQQQQSTFKFGKVFPFFILYFILASVITTICLSQGVSQNIFAPFKQASKFFIVVAMSAIGLNTDVVKLVKSGGKPILMGATCWLSITAVSLGMQALLNLW